jgi:hypothetical protein
MAYHFDAILGGGGDLITLNLRATDFQTRIRHCLKCNTLEYVIKIERLCLWQSVSQLCLWHSRIQIKIIVCRVFVFFHYRRGFKEPVRHTVARSNVFFPETVEIKPIFHDRCQLATEDSRVSKCKSDRT